MKKHVDQEQQQGINAVNTQNNSKQTGQPSFVDNSAKTQKAAQLQTTANQYTAHRKPAFTDNRQQEPVVQAKLEKGKLNVVGENHNTSSLRRHDERWMTKSKLKTENYWTETAFMTGDPEHTADPFELRMMQAFSLLDEGLDREKQQQLVAQCLQEIKALCDKVKAKEDGFELSQERRKYYKKLGKDVKKWIKIVRPFVENKEKQSRTKMQAVLGEELPKIRQSIADSRGLGQETLIKSDDVGLQRSIAMHEAANAEATKEGVWKIGERHVEHIQENEMNDQAYELTPMREYDEELAAFKRSKRFTYKP